MDSYDIVQKAKEAMQIDETDNGYFAILYLEIRNLTNIKNAIKLTMSELRDFNNMHNTKREIKFTHLFMEREGRQLDEVEVAQRDTAIKMLEEDVGDSPKTDLGNLFWIEAYAKSRERLTDFANVLETVKKSVIRREK